MADMDGCIHRVVVSLLTRFGWWVGETFSSSSDGATTSSSASYCGLLIPGSLRVEFLDPERFSWRLGKAFFSGTNFECFCSGIEEELIQKKPFVVVETLAGREVFRFLREEEEEDDGAAFRFVRS